MSRHYTPIAVAYRTALLRASSQLPKRLRHSFLRGRIAQLRREQASHHVEQQPREVLR